MALYHYCSNHVFQLIISNREVWLSSLDLSNDNKNTLLDRSKQFKEWVASKWEPFIAEVMPGDEVWRFQSPPETWANMAGRAGYSIVRDGTIIRSLVTLLN